MRTPADLEALYRKRTSSSWPGRLLRFLAPPAPLITNPAEPKDFLLGRWNLYIGGAGRFPDGYVNIDLFPMPGIHVAADTEQLPFRSNIFQRVECDAVLEHVRDPAQAISEFHRVLAPGAYLHIVTPFCHPFHEYPKDYRRFTLDGLKELATQFEIVAEGWRTGPTATLLIFTIEYVKLLLPFRLWRALVHFIFGWLLFPFRYIDLFLLQSSRAQRLGNHCYLWLRKGGTGIPACVGCENEELSRKSGDTPG